MQVQQPQLATFFDESPASRKKLIFHQGSSFFRQRLALSLLSSRPVKIEQIRSNSDVFVGLKPYELSFIQLINQLSNGTKIKISETGTEVHCYPGVLTGGPITFSTDTSRPLSYYLEPILLLAPFCKQPLSLHLKGKLQNDVNGYNSIYKIKFSGLPILQQFGVIPDLTIISRSCEVSEIKFTCTIRRQLITLRNQFNSDCGKVKKVRGLAYGFRVSPQLLNRVVTASKGAFLPYLSDVYITTDQVKRSKSKDPGYGLVLYGITTKNVCYSADGFLGKKSTEVTDDDEDPMRSGVTTVVSKRLDDGQGLKRKFNIFNENEEDNDGGVASKKKKGKKTNAKNSVEVFGEATNDTAVAVTSTTKMMNELETPEDLGEYVAQLLLKEMSTRTCVDSVFQWLVLGLMALSPRDVASVILGQLTPFTIQYLRDLKTFFGVTFKVEELGKGAEDDDDEDTISNRKYKLNKLSCLGTGYINLNKTMV